MQSLLLQHIITKLRQDPVENYNMVWYKMEAVISKVLETASKTRIHKLMVILINGD
jgi:hypothetical protein